jgi:ribonuclease E
MAEEANLGVDLPLFQAPKVNEQVFDGDANISEEGTGRSRQKRNTTPADTSVPRNTRRKRGTPARQADGAEGAHGEADEQSDPQEDNQGRRVRKRNRNERPARRERNTSHDDAPEPGTRLNQKKQRRNDTKGVQRRRNIITEAEFLAKRENVERKMVIRDKNGEQQISILEDGILVEHYVSQQENASVVGNIYLGKVQNVLPGMEAAFVDIGVGRNGVLYAGEVNWDESGLAEGEPKRIEQALNKGDVVLVQATKDPIGNKGARLTSQVTLAGRYLVLIPSSGITGISKKIPDRERKRIRDIVNANQIKDCGIIIRTAAQGVSEEDLIADIKRLEALWEKIDKKAKAEKAPVLLHAEPKMYKKVLREVFTNEFAEIVISGKEKAVGEIKGYIDDISPELSKTLQVWTEKDDVFEHFRIGEQLVKAFDRKVWLPSGGTLVIDRTEAMTVIDINTGKFVGKKGQTLEETVTANNLEAAEEIVHQLRLRDIGGIVVIDFIDMMVEANREAVLRRLIECLMRDRTKHQVAEVTSLGLVQLTRKRVGQGLIEAFTTDCENCQGRGYIVHSEPVKKDINAAIVAESPEGWYDHFIGASHELDDGSKIDKIEADDKQRIKNQKMAAAMAAAAGVK